MHEFSVAAGIIEEVLKEAERHKVFKVKKIVLELGCLSMLSREQLSFALEVLAEGTVAEGMVVEYRSVPLTVVCARNHVNEVMLEECSFNVLRGLMCPACGGEVSFKGGRECVIKEIVAE